MANHNKLLQAQSLAKELYEFTKSRALARANPPEGQDINKGSLKRLIDEAEDEYTAYRQASLAVYLQGTFTEEDERNRFLNRLSLERVTHHGWLNRMKQIFRNLELAANPPIQLGTNAITNRVEQLDEVTTSIAKSSLLHKENTDLITINTNLPRGGQAGDPGAAGGERGEGQPREHIKLHHHPEHY